MSVLCNHCGKPIESQQDLIVERKWWLFPKPLHKACWADLFTTHGGVGTISYQTGAFQNRKQPQIAINTAFFSLIAVVALVIGIAILFLDFSGGTATVNGVARTLTSQEQLILKAIIFVILLVPMIQRVYSSTQIESKIPKKVSN